MHELHWPSNLPSLLSLCTCIPNLDEMEQFLEQLEHGNQSTTDGQTDRGTEGQTQINSPPFSSKSGGQQTQINSPPFSSKSGGQKEFQ